MAEVTSHYLWLYGREREHLRAPGQDSSATEQSEKVPWEGLRWGGATGSRLSYLCCLQTQELSAWLTPREGSQATRIPRPCLPSSPAPLLLPSASTPPAEHHHSPYSASIPYHCSSPTSTPWFLLCPAQMLSCESSEVPLTPPS